MGRFTSALQATGRRKVAILVAPLAGRLLVSRLARKNKFVILGGELYGTRLLLLLSSRQGFCEFPSGFELTEIEVNNLADLYCQLGSRPLRDTLKSQIRMKVRNIIRGLREDKEEASD